MKFIDISGKRFGNLVVIKRGDNKILPNGLAVTMWECACDCGNKTIVTSANLRKGVTKSCGCKRGKAGKENVNYKHGKSNTRLYKIWEGMHKRCKDVNSKSYKNYGGRGIEICKQWNEYENFEEWALKNGYSDNLTIDRINVNQGYYPDNCRWATNKQQSNNRRSNRIIEYKGKRKTLSEWAAFLNVPYSRLQTRLDNGWTIEEAFTIPKLNANRKYRSTKTKSKGR